MAKVKRKFQGPLPPNGLEIRKGRAVLTATERPMGAEWAVAYFHVGRVCLIWVHDASIMVVEYQRALKRYMEDLKELGWSAEWVDTSLERLQQKVLAPQWPSKWSGWDMKRRLELEQMRTRNAARSSSCASTPQEGEEVAGG